MKLCAGRPAQWWWTGDDGNRLALALCRACPLRASCVDPDPYGVIVAGVAWSDTGRPLGVCHCGYPQTNQRHADGGCCRWCSVTTLPAVPKALYDRLRQHRQHRQSGRPGVRRPRRTQPCGTVAAAWRHRKRREPLDEACRQAERDRKAAQRNGDGRAR